MRIRTLVSGTALAAGVAGLAATQFFPYSSPTLPAAAPTAAPSYVRIPYMPYAREPDEVLILRYGIDDGRFSLRCADYTQGPGPSHGSGPLTARLVNPGGSFTDYKISDPRHAFDGAPPPDEFYLIMQLPRSGMAPETVHLMEGNRILASDAVPPRRTCQQPPGPRTPANRR